MYFVLCDHFFPLAWSTDHACKVLAKAHFQIWFKIKASIVETFHSSMMHAMYCMGRPFHKQHFSVQLYLNIYIFQCLYLITLRIDLTQESSFSINTRWPHVDMLIYKHDLLYMVKGPPHLLEMFVIQIRFFYSL